MQSGDRTDRVAGGLVMLSPVVHLREVTGERKSLAKLTPEQDKPAARLYANVPEE